MNGKKTSNERLLAQFIDEVLDAWIRYFEADPVPASLVYSGGPGWSMLFTIDPTIMESLQQLVEQVTLEMDAITVDAEKNRILAEAKQLLEKPWQSKDEP